MTTQVTHAPQPRDGARQQPRVAPITGPHAIYVHRIPAGATIDVSHLVSSLLVELACQFDEDPQRVAQQLTAIADAEADHDQAARLGNHHSDAQSRRDELADQLLQDIGGASQPVYGEQARRLADVLLTVVSPGRSGEAAS